MISTALVLALLAQPLDSARSERDGGWALLEDDNAQGERVLKVLIVPLAEPESAKATFEPSWGAASQVNAPEVERALQRLVLEGPATLVVLTLDTRLGLKSGRAALATLLAMGVVPELRFAGPTNVKGQPMPEVLALMKEVPSIQPLSPAQIRGVFQGAYGELRQCYVKQLEANTLEGRLAVELVVLTDGKVDSAKVYQSQLSAPEVERCVAEVLKAVRFPKLRGAQFFTIRWPFKFIKGADKPPPAPIRK